ncbi:MAG: diaminopimelate decarboxylase [Desulfobacterales bacterium]|nr:diaminopimelate decarboxylase [Desulfobacterales bacterium]
MELIDGSYRIQGVDVHEICEAFGTPLFLYDADHIRGQVETFRKAFAGIEPRIKYACKALTNINILKLMKKLGVELDTVSISEVRLGLMAGFSPGEIIYTPTCIPFDEIEEAVTLGASINLDNVSVLEKFGRKYEGSIPVCIRLNPNITSGADADKVDWWHKQSKFGISLSLLETVKRIEAKYGMIINGIHIHSSSVIMSPEISLEGARTVFDIAMDFKNLEFIDFGGGIKVDVGDGAEVIDIFALGRAMETAFEDFSGKYGRRLALWFEPGRFLVGNSGTLLTTCAVVKTNDAAEFVGVNSGFNHLIRPMFYDAYHEILNVSNPRGKMKKYNVVGNLCEIDNFAVGRMINEVKEGDVIAIRSAGAYGYSMASSYNSRFKPAEALVYNGEAKLIRRRETFEDLTRALVEIDI